MRVSALLASHNRREKTLACLTSFFGQALPPGTTLGAVLVDDGSTDGTAQLVRERFPGTEVIEGSGELFWARAMQLAEQRALETTPDYLLWLNDDVVLDRDALSGLLTTARIDGGSIAVGALRDPRTGEVIYSGVRRRGLHPLRIYRVEPGDDPIEVETFNGNAVLVPYTVAAQVGPIDGALGHAAADFDYGLRAGRVGVTTLLAPGTVGTCAGNRGSAPWLDPSLTTVERIRLLFGPKGYPPRPRARYLKRHGGPAWPIFWVAPYARLLRTVARSYRRSGSS